VSAVGKRLATLEETRASARQQCAARGEPYTPALDSKVQAHWWAAAIEDLDDGQPLARHGSEVRHA
jgi:hypothetical protein